jgi:tRNA-(ms[2]io[6]A)-hydroxylase
VLAEKTTFINAIMAELMPPLLVPTPTAWCEYAAAHLDLLLIDHAHCEKKAASMALNLLYRYPEHHELSLKMSRLAREELRHMEQVLILANARGITLRHLSPSRYGAGLHQHVRTHEPARLVDTLVVGALFEARSCERFARLIPYLPDDLAEYYLKLLKCEARHFNDYLTLAETFDPGAVSPRLAFFAEQEVALIERPDTQFRFHSGVPV